MNAKKVLSDLLTVILFVLLTDVFVLTPGLSETNFRLVLVPIFVLFLPGYSLIAALYPAKSDLDGIQRIAFSFGMSIVVTSLIGLCLNFTPWGIRLIPTFICISIFTFLMCGLAHLNRAKLAETEVFEVSLWEIGALFKAKILRKSGSGLDRVFTVFLFFSIFLLVATLFYEVVTPKEGEHFTEFYILGPEGKPDNYTTKYFLGESGTVTVGIVNHEYRPINYTIEMKLENESLPFSPNLTQISLVNSEKWEKPVTFTPPFDGENMKLEFLLFNETDKNVPYKDLYLWIDVNASN
jgi:uncharacterized membrane protein